MQLSYDALVQSVYDGLKLQTRLKPYMDGISLVVNDTRIALDFSGTTTVFQARHDAAPGEAVRDLLDLQRISGTYLTGMGWDGYAGVARLAGRGGVTTDQPSSRPPVAHCPTSATLACGIQVGTVLMPARELFTRRHWGADLRGGAQAMT